MSFEVGKLLKKIYIDSALKKADKLNELHEKYHSKDFSVLGFPCNQFGGQEPGNNKEIQNFCF